jgi:hypothetical protein
MRGLQMVRTLNPNAVVDQFTAGVAAARDRYLAIYEVLGDAEGTDLTLRKSLTADFAFRVGTEWELFQHRWHLAAISKHPTTFVALVQKRLDSGLERGEARHILETLWDGATTVHPRLSVDQIDALIDPDGYNVTFKDGQAWAAEAGKHLDPRHANLVRNIVSDPENESLVALVKSVRNAIAHNSANSLDLLNAHIRSRPGGSKVGLVGQRNGALLRDGSVRVRDVPTYLHRWQPVVRSRRVTYMAHRIVEVAELLRS